MNKAPKAKVPGVSEQFTTSLQTVVDYLWADEQEAHNGLAPEARRHHVFHSLQVLRRWLDAQQNHSAAAQNGGHREQ